MPGETFDLLLAFGTEQGMKVIMKSNDVARHYAEEVYAACATVGFSSVNANKLKAMLDDADVDMDDLLGLAQSVQRDTVVWVTAEKSGP